MTSIKHPFKFKATSVDADRLEVTFSVCYHEDETLSESAKQTWINIGDMSRVWVIERDYQAECYYRP